MYKNQNLDISRVDTQIFVKKFQQNAHLNINIKDFTLITSLKNQAVISFVKEQYN